MICKTITASSFGGSVMYNYEKIEELNGNIILSRGLSQVDDKAQVIRDFETQAACYRSTQLTQKAIHAIVSFSPDDKKMTNEQMAKIAADYIDKRELSNTQYVVVRHEDKAHQHFHIIANRISDNNKLIDVSFSKNRDYEVARELEKKYGLVNACDIKEQRINVLQLNPADRLKHEVKSNLEAAISKSQNVEGFAKLMKEKGIDFKYVYSTKREGNIVGCVFERDGFKVSGGSIGMADLHKKLATIFLEKTYSNQVATTQSFGDKTLQTDITKIEIRNAIEKLANSCKTVEGLKAKLAMDGIQAKIVTNREGKTVGIKFTKDDISINGSSIGKGYSYGALEDRLAGQKWQDVKENSWEKMAVKSGMKMIIDNAVSSCTSITELKEKLESNPSFFKMKMAIIYDKENKSQVKGVRFTKDGLSVSGSELGKEYSYKALKTRLQTLEAGYKVQEKVKEKEIELSL